MLIDTESTEELRRLVQDLTIDYGIVARNAPAGKEAQLNELKATALDDMLKICQKIVTTINQMKEAE